MANLQEIKRRVESTKKTKQITSAVEMVSTSKLNRIQKQSITYRKYADRVKYVLNHVIESNSIDQSLITQIPLLQKKEIKKTGLLILTSDKGLVGGYNNSIFKKVTSLMEEENLNKENTIILAMGNHGISNYKKQGFELSLAYDEIPDIPKFPQVETMIKEVTKQFNNKKFDQLFVISNHFVNRLSNEPVAEKVLPISVDDIVEEKNDSNKVFSEYEFEPSSESMLKILIPQYLESTLYGKLLDSKTAEHSASSSAMSSATKNADDIIFNMNLKYNRARQSAITTEITEIIGGVTALDGD